MSTDDLKMWKPPVPTIAERSHNGGWNCFICGNFVILFEDDWHACWGEPEEVDPVDPYDFYNRSIDHKLDLLDKLPGIRVNVEKLLDCISDGAGGSERASFGTDDGKVLWVTCLGEIDFRTQYAGVVVANYGLELDVERVSYCSVASSAARSTDCPLALAEAAQIMLKSWGR
jgi:hypothetical protein